MNTENKTLPFGLEDNQVINANPSARISPLALHESQVKYSRYRLTLETIFSKEDLLDSSKWIQVSKSHKYLNAGDIIEVLREDQSFFAELLVIGHISNHLFTKMLRFVNLSEESKGFKKDNFELLWKGPVKKWALIRKEDKKEFRDKFNSKEEAEQYLKDNY